MAYGMFGVAEGEALFTARQKKEQERRAQLKELDNILQEMNDIRADLLESLETPGVLAVTMDSATARRITQVLAYTSRRLIAEKASLAP